MSGTKFNTPFETKFFKWFLRGELNNELWFWLKLSSAYEMAGDQESGFLVRTHQPLQQR
jgi:hypothetical protein